MTVTVEMDLDELARQEFAEEQSRHVAALAAIRPGDADCIAAEFNRHLDRVNEILRDLGGRLAG